MSLVAYDGVGPQFVSSQPGQRCSQHLTRGWKTGPDERQRQRRHSARRLVVGLTVRGGYFYDNYETPASRRRPASPVKHRAVGLPFAASGSLQLPIRRYNTPRAQITDFDTTKRGFINARLHPVVQPRRSAHAQGRRRLPARDQRRSIRAYPGGYVSAELEHAPSRAWRHGRGGRGTYGYYEVNDFGTFGTVERQHHVAVRAGPVEPDAAADAQPRRPHRERSRFRAWASRRRAPSSSASATRLRRASAPRYDVRGDGRVKLYGSWGRYFDWTKYELSRGSFGGDIWQVYYRSLDSPSTSISLNLEQHARPRPVGQQPPVPRSARANYVDNVDPDIKPMYQDSTNAGLEVSRLTGELRVRRSLRPQRPEADDRGHRRPRCQRRRSLRDRQPR